MSLRRVRVVNAPVTCAQCQHYMAVGQWSWWTGEHADSAFFCSPGCAVEYQRAPRENPGAYLANFRWDGPELTQIHDVVREAKKLRNPFLLVPALLAVRARKDNYREYPHLAVLTDVAPSARDDVWAWAYVLGYASSDDERKAKAAATRIARGDVERVLAIALAYLADEGFNQLSLRELGDARAPIGGGTRRQRYATETQRKVSGVTVLAEHDVDEYVLPWVVDLLRAARKELLTDDKPRENPAPRHFADDTDWLPEDDYHA